MKSGFDTTLDAILRKHGMLTVGVIGTVIGGTLTKSMLKEMGYNVESGYNLPKYDFIYLSKKESTVVNVLDALTKINNGCIIIFRLNGDLGTIKVMNAWGGLKGLEFLIYEFAPKKFFGVILKGY